jgi:predicted lipoprotein with Yx(FWY)xxD motif
MPRFPASALAIVMLLFLSAPAFASPPAAAAPAPRPTVADRARAAAESPVPVWIRNGILVEQGGRALYTFDNDAIDQSRCDRPCEALWPPHYAEEGAKPHGPFTIARSYDGRPMWAWQGKPLYRWISDRKRGAAGGDGVAAVWFLVRVPQELKPQVVEYFPMPMPRPGTTRTPATPRTTR